MFCRNTPILGNNYSQRRLFILVNNQFLSRDAEPHVMSSLSGLADACSLPPLATTDEFGALELQQVGRRAIAVLLIDDRGDISSLGRTYS